MKKLALSLCVAVPAALALGNTAFDQDVEQSGQRVAVVDMLRLTLGHAHYLEEQGAVRDWRDDQLSTLKAGYAAMKKAEDELAQFEPDTLEFLRKRRGLESGLGELRSAEGSLNLSVETRLAFGFSDAHFLAKKAVRQYARDHGIDCVMNYSDGPLPGSTRRELASESLLRTVVYRSEPLDITDQVLEAMK